MFEIAKKVFLVNIRSSRYVLFNAIFPIFLMVLIGTLLTSTFENEININKLEVRYYDNGSSQSKLVLEEAMKNTGDMDILFKEIKDLEEGKQLVRLNEIALVELDGDKINIYTNDKGTIDSGMLNTLFNTVSNRLNTINIMYQENQVLAQQVVENNSSDTSIVLETISRKSAPSSFDYYGVAELTMITLYLVFFPILAMRYENRHNLKERLKLTGISDIKYYLGSLLGYIGISVVCTMPGFVFSIVVLKTNWGPNLIVAYLALISLCVMICTVGILLETLFKDSDRVFGLLQGLLLPLLSFLGGSYVYIPDDVGGILQIITNISPIKWMNSGIYRYAFGGDNKMLIIAVSLNITLAIIFMIAVLAISKREEAVA